MIMYRNRTNSLIHSINPFIKLILTIFFIISCFLVKSMTPLFFLAMFLIALILASNISFKQCLQYLWLGLFSFIIIIFLDLIINFTFMPLISLIKAVLIVLMLILMILTTKLSEIALAFEILFYPLKIFGINPRKLANKVVLSIKFIFIFKEEFIKAIKSHNNRTIKKQSLKNKILNFKNIIFFSYNKAINIKSHLKEVMIIKNYNFDITNKIDYNLKAKEMDFALVAMQIFILIAIIVKR